MIQGAESAGQVNRFATRQKQRTLAVLQRTGNNRARADSRADAPSARGVFVISAALPETLIEVKDNADCLLGMFGVRSWKSKNRDDALSVGRVQVRTLFNKMRSGLANKLCSGFRKGGGLRIFRECKFVADIGYHYAYLIRFRLGIERSCAVANTSKFLFRKAIGKKCSHQMRMVPP